MRTRLLAATSVALAAALAGPAPAQDSGTRPGTFYVTAGTVHTGTGETFVGGAVAIVDGKVKAVGAEADVAEPEGATRYDAGPSAVVIPGLVAAWSEHVAAGGRDPASLAPDVRAIDGFDFTSDESALLSGGVTTVVVSPGSTQVVSGRVAVVKTAGSERARRLLREEAGLAAGVGDGVQTPPPTLNPPDEPDAALNPLLPHRSQLPVTRAGSILLLRELLGAGAGGYAAEVAAGRAPLWISARSTGDIEAALAFAGESGVSAVLVGALGAGAMSGEIADSKLPVVLEWPTLPGRVTGSESAEDEAVRARALANPRLLAEKGVTFALTTDDAALRHLLFVVASAAAEGLDPARALAAVTSDAAKIAGVSDRVGALAPGLDGDLVILSGPPHDFRAVPVATVAEGNLVWERREQGATVVVRAAEVHLGDGRVLSPGEVAYQDGRIVEVGPTVGVPPGARIIDLGPGAVMPGMIDAFSHAGLAGTNGGSGGDLTTAFPAAKAADGQDPAFALLAERGVTTILSAPGGNGRVAGRASVLKTAGPWPGRRVLRTDAGMVVRLRDEGDLDAASKQIEGAVKQARDYRGSFEKYEKELKEYTDWKKKHDEEEKKAAAEAAKKAAEAKKAEKEDGAPEEKKPEEKPTEKPAEKKPDAKKDDEKKEPRKPKKNEALEGWAAVLDGKAPLLVRSRTVEELRAALSLLGGLKLPGVIVGADDARRVRDAIVKAKVPVIASPRVLVSDRNGDVNLLRELALSGIRSSVGTDSYLGGHELRELLAFAVRGGLSPSTAVKMVTGDAARMLGVEARVGTIEPGRDADLIFLSAPPFAPGSGIVRVVVGGEEVRRDDR